MMGTFNLMYDDDKRHHFKTNFSTPSVNKFDQLVITQSSQSVS
jgi:hypothetical protein